MLESFSRMIFCFPNFAAVIPSADLECCRTYRYRNHITMCGLPGGRGAVVDVAGADDRKQ